jgi:hypothetical protein
LKRKREVSASLFFVFFGGLEAGVVEEEVLERY